MFPEVVVEVSLAMICFLGQCYNALVGADTPRGEYQLQLYNTTLPGYGGDILVFKETEKDVFAIHRVIDVPNQNRLKRIESKSSKNRLITNGCINVESNVYLSLKECCHASKVIIK